MNLLAELQALEKKNNDNKLQKARLEQKDEQITSDLAKAQAELSEFGVDEAELETVLEQLSIDIENDIEVAKEALR